MLQGFSIDMKEIYCQTKHKTKLFVAAKDDASAELSLPGPEDSHPSMHSFSLTLLIGTKTSCD